MSRARRRPPRQQQPISIRLWDIGWGLWGALRLVLGSLLAETLRRARLLKSREEAAPRPPPGRDDDDTPSLLAAQRATTRRPSKGSSKASEVCGRSWITWVSLWASPRRWVRAGTGFAWLLVSRWTSLVGLTLRWTSSVVIAIKDADAKSTR